MLEQSRRAAAALCLYRGLEVFREDDAPFFCGREAFSERLRKAVSRRSLVAVVGASGSGKSLVVRVGLIPSLRRMDVGTVWEIVTLVPGPRPLQALIGALLPLLEPEAREVERLTALTEYARDLLQGRVHLYQIVERIIEKQSGTDRLLLVVDQWEELYAYPGNACDERCAQGKRASACFVDQLLTATKTAPLTVVLTLRADFYGEAIGHRGLSDRLRVAQINLGPMTREELERAITSPAQTVGLSFDPGRVVTPIREFRSSRG